MKMNSYYFKVIPELQNFVDFVVYFEGNSTLFPDRMIPSTYVHLIINAGSLITVYPDCNDTNPVPISKGWLKGLHETPYGIEFADYTRLISIRFKPCAAYSLTLKPMNLFANQVIPVESINIPGFTDFYDDFSKTTDPDNLINLVNDYLLTHIKPKAFEWPRVFRALRLMNLQKKEVTIPRLAFEAGVSPKHLNSLFDKCVGVSPKKFACILRFNEILPLIANQEYVDWMMIVEKYGYFDQSHFIHDFKKFTGLTPTEFINDYFFIDNNVFRKDANLHLLQPELASG